MGEHTGSADIGCIYVQEHPRIDATLDAHEKRLDRQEGQISDLMQAVARIEGAWRMAVVIASLTSGVVGALAGVGAELLMRR